MNLSMDPIRPYLGLIKAVLAVVIVGFIFFGGRSCGVQSAAETIAAKDKALLDASASLGAAGAALRAQSEANAARIAEAEQAEADAQDAALVAVAAAERLDKQLEAFEKAERRALRRPGCKELWAMDLEATCGL